MPAAPPSQISPPQSPNVDRDEAEYRERLQRALGGDYELRELVGRGGFGAVYKAWDRRLERDVAVKALRHDLFPTRALLERFQREAKAVAKLRHAHILPIYSVGEGDGIAYMIMPFVRGESLGALLKRGEKLSVDASLRIAIEVARALDAAHRAGIVHRDVKPENIMLEGEERLALLADFGIARAADADSELTGTGVAIGTPQYMSPEQAAGEHVDARSDLYSLGAVVFEMLAGRRVYDAPNYQQFLVQQFTTEPPRIETLVDLPATVGDTVTRALERDAAKRWQTATDFAAALTTAAKREAPPRDIPESWFARNGPLLFTLLLLNYYVDTAARLARLGSGNAPAVRRAVELFEVPFGFVFSFALLLLIINLVGTIVRARRATGSWRSTWQAAFGQPRWWQIWYPKSLRHPRSIWDQLRMHNKVMRSVLWLYLVAVLALPFPIMIAGLARASAQANLALPLPLRMLNATLDVIQYPAGILVLGTVVGIFVVAARAGVSPRLVLRLLFTLDRDDWSSPEARRLLSTR